MRVGSVECPQYLQVYQLLNSACCLHLRRPKTLDDVAEAVKLHDHVRANGEGHSWNQVSKPLPVQRVTMFGIQLPLSVQPCSVPPGAFEGLNLRAAMWNQ
jgi:hypothetical protein